MPKCQRCGEGYKFWGNSRKRFTSLCDPCAEKEEVVATRVKSDGLGVLVEHYVPGSEFTAVAVGTWKDLGSRLSSLGGSLFLAVLGLGASAKFVNRGLIVVTRSELVLATLDENLAGKDFNWADLNEMAIPSHYTAGSSGKIHAKVKRVSLATVTAKLEQVEGGRVLSIAGAIKCRVVVPSAWHPDNDASASSIAKHLGANTA